MRSTYFRSAACAAALLVLAAGVFTPGEAVATPDPDAAIINTRIFNDCSSSVLTTTNNYPALISIADDVLDCPGFANRHNWRFSEDGGATAAVFNNDAHFRFGADLVISGTGEGEAGLQISPWWSQDVDGTFNVKTAGEIACFGGRLPFYSFTGSQGVTYVKGTSIYMEMIYHPNDLTSANPATIEYILNYNSTAYTSGAIPFDEGNPGEPYGTWGMLDDGRVGGHVQCLLDEGNPDAGLQAEWSNIVFQDLGSVATDPSTWGQIKATYLD